MEEIHYWIGLVVFWLSAIVGSSVAVGLLGKLLIDELGRRYKVLWIILEFSYYKKEFKKWVKDKKRHPKSENYED